MALAQMHVFETETSASTTLIRCVSGIIAAIGGVQTFLFPQMRSDSRFAEIGFPAPRTIATCAGIVWIEVGVLIVLGVVIRNAVLALVIAFIVTITSTKIPVLFTYGYWLFTPEGSSYNALWGFLSAWRTDFAMLLGSVYVLIVGAGAWSLDASLQNQLMHSSAGGAPRPEDGLGR